MLSTFPQPTVDLVKPDIVFVNVHPFIVGVVNVGLAKLAFKFNAVCVAVEIGLL